MKKFLEMPIIEYIEFQSEDVITTSGGMLDGGAVGGGYRGFWGI